MRPWELIERVEVPGDEGRPLELWRRGEEFLVKVGGRDLMGSRAHGSERALAELACARLRAPDRARVLIGGLGMGYTLAAALAALGPHAQLVVAELVPAVVTWNQGLLGPLAGRPLDDPRVTVHVGDVAGFARAPGDTPFDAILLDVDNGPDSLTQPQNDWLYQPSGLAALREALAPGGTLAIWSAFDDPAFTRRLERAGFATELVPTRAHKGRGARHWIWLASPRKVANTRRPRV